ncbi:HNH endonuclease [Streptomyces albofaciens JCM 4342]|uniref:HNH endonuclease family protein n=1 Tax=Streptomyces albofaciens TaxID=66866 RepID=UPI000AB3C55F|nr:HNH endonuclease family protein [Streptomyces albofaciens]KAA6215004.1 HNH endonuclease [Streptomyces albofaciens JCM 4342]
MLSTRRWLRAATALLGLGAVLGPAAAPAGAAIVPVDRHRGIPEPPPVEEVLAQLGKLAVEAPHSMSGYSRAKFPHWIKQYGQCDTREVVLSRDGQSVSQDSLCRAVAGTWHSPYDGKILGSASKVDIDHMVPLANAWRSGADTWTTDKRKRFANDLNNPQLIAVSASSNRSKGDQSPDQWSPPNTDFWCTYSRAWTNVKYVYGASVTQPEKDKLTTMLNTCD